jgi:hypothetical protein
MNKIKILKKQQIKQNNNNKNKKGLASGRAPA